VKGRVTHSPKVSGATSGAPELAERSERSVV